ncbi:N-6 DNA methylase, partial [Streptomyces scabiei]
HMVDRAERALSDEDIALIAATYHSWLGREADASPVGGRVPSHSDGVSRPADYENTPGFAYSATLAEIKAADYALTPGRYVGAAEVEDDGEP